MGSHAELLEQIRKLRRLATSSVPAEAAEAAKKAQQLMKRYGISAADLEEPKPKAPLSPAGPPATITLKIGTLRIRWKL